MGRENKTTIKNKRHCEEPATGDEAISAEVLTEIASPTARNDR